VLGNLGYFTAHRQGTSSIQGYGKPAACRGLLRKIGGGRDGFGAKR